jgi:hypothetical protein
MSEYNYLFDSKQLNYNNIILLHELLQNIIENDKILNNMSIKSDSFLEFILPYKQILEKIYLKDSLYIYNIIDFYKNNEDIIEKKKNFIKEFLNENNLNLITFLLRNSIDDNNNNELLSIHKGIIINKEYYFARLFNQIWLNNFKNFEISNINLILMAKQVLILYYFNEFYNIDKIDQTMFNNDLYQDFLKVLVKYKLVYNDINETDINLKTFEEVPTINENKIKLFYKFCLDNKLMNKNLLTWFFIIFHKELPKYLYNDFYYIILEIKHNILEVISKILLYVGIDFYKYNKIKFNELIKNISDNHDYLGKIYENLKFDNTLDYENITNNIYLIKKIYEIQEDIYTFLYDLELEKLELDQYYMFIITSPLDNSWNSNLYSIDYNITENFMQLLKIYNSIECKNFSGNCMFLTLSGIKRIKNIEKELIDQIDLNFFDKYILFINIIKYLSNFEIIPYNKEIILFDYSLNNIIKDYLSIFPKEKLLIYNYGN